MDNLFSNLDTTEVTEVNTPVENAVIPTEAPVAKKNVDPLKAKMIQAMNETLKNDPQYTEVANTKSKHFEVVNTLGFGDKGNVVVDKTASERSLVPTSKIEGYTIKNISDEAIQYKTEVYKEVDGIYVGEVVTKTVNPGEEVALNRKYTTILFSAPEYSFKLANGSIVKGPKKATSVDDYLEGHYFKFDKELNASVNSDEYKRNIGEKKGDEWVVKPAFIETFGYLNNPKAVNKGGRKSKNKVSTAEVQANFVKKLVEGTL